MNEANLLAFSISITGPIFMVVLLGLLLKRLGVIHLQFVQPASDLVFKIGLPAILFLSIYRADLDHFSMGLPLLIAIPITLLLFALSLPIGRLFIADNADCGVFVQGAFRGNLAVIGLAFCSNAYGEPGLAAAAVPVAALTVLYNLLAVVALHPIESDNHLSPLRRIALNTLKNPLLIGIALGFIMKFSGLPLPRLIEDTGNYFARMTLPLALLCIGASMNMKTLKHSGMSTVTSSLLKLIVAPLIMITVAIWLGVRGMDLGILFFLVASPTAVASFIQVKAMGGNGEFAANIVVMSTLLGIVKVTGGLMALKAFTLI